VDNFDPKEVVPVKKRSEIDRWILSRLQGVIDDVKDAFEGLSFHTAVKSLDFFVLEELSNWFVRRSRRRFYGSEMTEDKLSGYHTLYEVLTTLSKLMAPFTPFLSEEIYMNLEYKHVRDNNLPSVHMQMFPKSNKAYVNKSLEDKMALALAITNAARTARAAAGIKARQPLPEILVLVEADAENLPQGLVEVVKKEINVKKLSFTSDDGSLVEYRVQPLLKVLAPKVKGSITKIKNHLENMTKAETKRVVKSINQTGNVKIEIEEEVWNFDSTEILVHSDPSEGYAIGTFRNVEVFLNTSITEELRLEGLARGIVRHIQETRKSLNLDYLDRINLFVYSEDEPILSAINKHGDYIKSETQSDTLEMGSHEESVTRLIDGYDVKLFIKKNNQK
jgi:isoleucyl-tRNA synthetase